MKLKSKYILSIILILAAFIRLYNISDRGLFAYDEGYYLRGAKFYYSVSRNVGQFIKLLTDKSIDVNEIKKQIQGLPPIFNPKPLHSIMLGIFTIIAGLHDFNGGIYSTIFALLNILIIFYLVKDISNEKTALVSAAILAVSQYHFAYSRCSYAEIDSLTFIILSIWLFIKENSINILSKKNNLFIGIFFGLGVATNYRFLWFATFIILFYFIYNRKYFLKRSIYFLMGMIMVFLIMEIPYIIIRFFKPFPPGMHSWLELLFKYYSKSHNPLTYAEHLGKPKIYPHSMILYYLFNGEGYFFSSLFALAGIIIACLSRKKDYLFIIVVAFISIILASFTVRGNKPHAFTLSFPFFAVVIALGLEVFISKVLKGKYYYIVYAVVALIYIFAAPKIYNELTAVSGYKPLSEYLKKNNGIYNYTTNAVMTRFYINRYSGVPLPRSKKEYENYSNHKKVRYFVKDFLFYTRACTPEQHKIAKIIMDKGQLVEKFNNDYVYKSTLRFINMNKFFENTKKYYSIPNFDKIEVYKFNPEILVKYFSKKQIN